MQDQQILNSTITIEEVIDKDKKLVIKGNNGSRVFTYSIWKTRQDGSDSATYSQFKTMGLRAGSTVMIGYVVDEYETEINGFPKKVQSKKIINFREASSQPAQTSQTTIPGRTEANRGVTAPSNDTFGRRLGVQGHINALLSNPNYYSPDSSVSISTLVKEAIAIEDEAEKQLNSSALRQAVQRHAPAVVEDLPTIQVEDEVDVSDIPF